MMLAIQAQIRSAFQTHPDKKQSLPQWMDLGIDVSALVSLEMLVYLLFQVRKQIILLMNRNNSKSITTRQKKLQIRIKGAHEGDQLRLIQQQYSMKQGNSLSDLDNRERQERVILNNQQQSKTKSFTQYNLESFARCKVPIYSLISYTASFKANIDKASIFGLGTLLGKFYEKDCNIKIENVMFVGNFKGSIEYQDSLQQDLYFQGNITQLIIILRKQQDQSIDPVLTDLAHDQTSFKGFFKGRFYKWEDITDLKDIHLSKQAVLEISNTVNLKASNLVSCTKQVYQKYVKHSKQPAKMEEERGNDGKKQKARSLQYYVPCVMRFEVQEVREINLEKSMAVVSGQLHIEIFYNDEIDELIKYTFAYKKEEERKQKINKKADYDSQTLLKLVIQFNRDFSLNLPLEALEDDFLQNQGGHSQDDEQNSQGSEWSIQDKTWDIEAQRDESAKIIKFKVWKRFNAEIDNSYGAFFAPFNLSVLRLVITANSFNLMNKSNEKIKVNLAGTDVLDFNGSSNSYDPFKPLTQLMLGDSQNQKMMLNRIHKINKMQGKDNGIYIIADNRLSCYPHYKNILINKNTSNDSHSWGFGIYDKKTLLQPPEVKKVSTLYREFNENWQNQKYTPFAFQKWNYFAIEIPIYKYVVIEMIQVFVPLILLSVVSLLIFSQSNGISDSSGFTTLSLRIVNVCSLMIAYVSLIPTLRENLPPMPTITLIQIITYVETLPNLLALINSMAYYTISLSEWQDTYQDFHDGIFIFCFTISLISLVTLLTVFITYALREYIIKLPKLPAFNQHAINYHSPHYVKFMEEIRQHRPEYTINIL